MTYLDYLPDTPYAELPASAKTEISAEEYARLQVLGSSLAEPAVLPDALGMALAAKVGAPTTTSPELVKTEGVHAAWRWVALLSTAAFLGTLLFTLSAKNTATALEPVTPKPEVIGRVVVERDTIETIVRDTVTRYKTRVEVQEVWDTIYLRRDVPIASTPTPEPEDEQAVSKSLSTGIDWGEITVRGVGEMGRE